MSATWQGGALGEWPDLITMLMDATPSDLVRLILAMAQHIDIYDPEAGDFDAGREVLYDLPGGAGLVPLDLSAEDLRVLREVLDVAVDVQRGRDA